MRGTWLKSFTDRVEKHCKLLYSFTTRRNSSRFTTLLIDSMKQRDDLDWDMEGDISFVEVLFVSMVVSYVEEENRELYFDIHADDAMSRCIADIVEKLWAQEINRSYEIYTFQTDRLLNDTLRIPLEAGVCYILLQICNTVVLTPKMQDEIDLSHHLNPVLPISLPIKDSRLRLTLSACYALSRVCDKLRIKLDSEDFANSLTKILFGVFFFEQDDDMKLLYELFITDAR